MVTCHRLPIFTYGSLCVPHKILVLASKIEGSMFGRLAGFKLIEDHTILQTYKNEDEVLGEILWINLEQYDELIQALDSYGEPSQKSQLTFKRFMCEPNINEPIYRNVHPTSIKCWAYKTI